MTSSRDLETFAYHQDHLVVVIPKNYLLVTKKTLKFFQTLAYKHIGLQPGSSLLGQRIGEAVKLKKLIFFAVQLTSFDGVRRMVESGLVIAILPDGVTQDQPEGSI